LAALLGVLTLSLALAAALPSGRSSYRYLSVWQEVWRLTRANYVERVGEDQLLEGAYRGMLASLDAASAYLAPGEEKGVLDPPGPARAGIELLPSGGVAVVVRVDPGSPAEEAGMRAGDQVWRIGERATRQLSWPQLSHLVSGKIGQSIEMDVLDGRTFRVREVELTLEAPAGPGYELEAREADLLYLRLRQLDRIERDRLVEDLSAEFEKSPEAALLLDLRGAVGLDLGRAALLAGALVPEGETWRLHRNEGAVESVAVPEGPKVEIPGDFFVLVDGSTAGTAEAIALALEERAGATLCGRSTYGLGSLPELIPLSRGGHLLLTTREIRAASGERWAGEGIDPDKVLRPRIVRADDIDAPLDLLLEAALEWIEAGAAIDEETGDAREAASLGSRSAPAAAAEERAAA
jgi:carboxyl-terminal processing protease